MEGGKSHDKNTKNNFQAVIMIFWLQNVEFNVLNEIFYMYLMLNILDLIYNLKILNLRFFKFCMITLIEILLN